MLDLIFLSLFVITPIICMFFLNRLGLSIWELTVPSFVAYVLFLLAYVGYFFLYFQLDSFRVEDGVVDKTVVFKAFLMSAYTLFSYCLGVFLCSAIVKSNFKVACSGAVRQMATRELVFLFFILLSVVFVLAIYVLKAKDLAIFHVLSDDIRDAKVVRSEMSHDFDGKYHWYSLFMHDISAFVSFALISAWMLSRRWIVALIALSSVLITSFSMIMSTEKAPLVWFLLGIFFVYVLTLRGGKIPLGKSIVILFSCILLLLLVDVLFMGSSSFLSALSSISSRAITGGITPSYFYIEFFPAEHDFLYGRSFPNPAGIFDYKPYPMTIEVMNWIHPEHYGSGIIGTAPTVFWGEVYANFGVAGVIFFPLLTGFMLSFLIFTLNKFDSSPLLIGLTVWMMLHFKDLAVTGISGFIFDIKLWSMLVIMFFFSLQGFTKRTYSKRFT
jgi:oligosaccharide repeat unit polymerase